MGSSQTRSVYIVDDEEDDRRRVLAILQDTSYRPQVFESGKTFMETAVIGGNCCVLLDVRMPDVDGLTVVTFMAETHPHCPVVMLSGSSTLPMAVEAMKRGAADFLEKPVERDALMQALERAFGMKPPLPGGALTREELLNKVTRREGQVLELLVQGHPNKVVAFQLGIAENTVEVHRQRLMRRLEAKNFAELVRMAVRAGI